MKYSLSTDSLSHKPIVPLIDRLTGPVGLILLAVLAVFLGIGSIYGGIVVGLLLLIAMVAIPAVYAIIVYPIFGIVVLMAMAFFLFFISRLGVDFPMGTAMDGLQAMLILGFLIKQKGNWDFSIYKSPVSVMVLVWIGYNVLQVANPWSESRMAWVYTVRTVAIVTLMYFVFIYHLRSIKSMRVVVVAWIILGLCGAIYGFKQEYIGIAPSELAGLWANPQMVSLLFINGAWRKYSLFSDPVSFSYTMVGASLLCIALLSGKTTLRMKILLGSFTVLFLMAMLFSGTRGAYVLVPVALIPFAILNFSKRIMLVSCIGAVFIAFLVVIPTGNPTLARFQTAFRPSDDPSFNVRKYNQKRIQPYILTHPFGGGLGSTGAWGARFAPNSFLASFPPDSGYMRVAVETGWVGMLIFCLLMYQVLKMGINNYYRIRNSELRTYCLAMTLIVFALNVGNFPQEAIVQFPNNILFYIAAAMLHTCYLTDKKLSKETLPVSTPEA
ncbi:O-antigen ligase family protein [Dyadobacter luticola]|uniref:O-antigen ligase family protein n=1 Tax=Dyadobacter luticola TaxID=1979387 RepID=A0A5R9L2E1_9BACT|nr:O-antigen ligase family protein [Dyadobacter luticola]TLV02591.1 O-antigen ligase family protein [Dyadobacter luticola]